MEILKLKIEGTFESQLNLTEYLRGVLEAVIMANTCKLPFHSFSACDDADNIVAQVTREEIKCPVCDRADKVRKDLDYPDTMRCCDHCGADFDNTGEIILDPRKL